MATGNLTVNQKLALGAGAGIAVLAIVLIASSASAAPAPGGGSSPSPAAPTLDPTSPLGIAAIALANAIQTSGGYQGSQAGLVIQYEQAKGLTVDAGYPGTNVMTALRADLAAMNNTSYPLVGTLTLYPWTAAAGWTAGNVPAAFAGANGSSLWSAGATVGT